MKKPIDPLRNHVPLVALLSIFLASCGGGTPDQQQSGDNRLLAMTLTTQSTAAPVTADSSNLKTWWHTNGELNATTAVADANVRRSIVYDAQVASAAAPSSKYDSFTYMSVPRSGRDKWGYTTDDGAEFAKAANMTMSWTSFQYGSDTWVDVRLKDGTTITSAADVTIRPTTLNFTKQMVDNKTIRILVPYSTAGYRFSVEFNSQQLTSYATSTGDLTTTATGNREVHTEPRNAMLVFAEPMPTATEQNQVVPDPATNRIYYPASGQVNNLDTVVADVIYFKPGTYYMPWNYRASLSSSVKWVYLAPGAYVKGAFQFPIGQSSFKVTGLGVLSGEKYVYEPDTNNGYMHRSSTTTDCHASCVKMLQFGSGDFPQTLQIQGITVTDPPYHSFVVYGNEGRFRMDVSGYKQLGAWYWQTDGLELYNGSTMKNSFLHSNDDVIKLYHSNITLSDIVVWKSENGPVVQWGWVPRTMDNVHLNRLDVIHNRMHWPGTHNICVINSAKHYLDPNANNLGDPTQWVTNVLLENVRVEGKSMCAMRLNAMSSWKNIDIRNLWIEAWNGLDTNTFKAMANQSNVRVTIGNETVNKEGLGLENFAVGTQRISKAANNWGSTQPGRMNFDGALWDNWNAW